MDPRPFLLVLVYLGVLVLSKNIHDKKCRIHACRLKNNCRCSHDGSPGGLKNGELPQIVIFTFDDGVTKRDYDYYQTLFSPERRNPNGCPITMTMFVSHNYTDYNLVNKLYKRGMEAAVHSVTHRIPTDFWKTPSESDLKMEVLGQKNNLHKFAHIPVEKINGWRSPFLQPSGETLYEILKRNGFSYDATLTTGRRTPSDNLWPFTLDYGWPLSCEVKPCPKNRYTGLWEFPVAPLIAPSGNTMLSYTYVDSYRPTTGLKAYKFLKDNFMAYYKGNKEPFMINMHTAWFHWKHNFYGMDLFIRELLTKDDVYIISVQKALAWITKPIPLEFANTYAPWSCPRPRPRSKPRYRPTIFSPSTQPTTTRDPNAPNKDVKCVQDVNCMKPSCRCDMPFDEKILPLKKVPQMVLLTFDDAVTVSNIQYYDRLFSRNRKNPNGCQISMTLFLQHNYTDYRFAKRLYDRGNEIAVHSLTHRYPNEWWKNAAEKDIHIEVQGMRENIEKFARIPEHHIVGWRSPFLQPTGDTLFKVLQDNDMSYDATLSVNRESFTSDQTWPFSLDYGWKRHCAIPKCPSNYYKGIWEFPVVSLINPVTKYPCSYVDACRPKNQALAFDYLMQNFLHYYNGSRAPFMLNMHAAWFMTPPYFSAMDEFIDRILNYDDVYILTVQQALEWMKSPVSITDAKHFKPWSCLWRPPRPTPPASRPPAPGMTRVTTEQDVSSGYTKEPDTGVKKITKRGRSGVSGRGGESDGGGDSGGLEWYVILLIGLVILALLIITALLIVSTARKRQAIQVQKLAVLAAAMSGDNGHADHANNTVDKDSQIMALETLKSIGSVHNSASDNIYHNIMELKRNKTGTASVTSHNGSTKQGSQHKPPNRPPSHAGPRQPSRSLPKTPSEEPSKPRNKNGMSSNRYEGDLDAVRNSVMDDLNAFSMRHSRASVASLDNHYHSLDGEWFNLQGNQDKD